MMSNFWGYAGVDTLAILFIGGMGFIYLVCTRIFVSKYGEYA